MKESLLVAAGVLVSIAAACSGPDFQSEVGSGASAGMGGSIAGKGGSSSTGGSNGSGASSGSVSQSGGPNPGTGGSQGVSGAGQTGGAPGVCTDASECPASSNPCVTPICDPGFGCGEAIVPDGPLPDDVPGDCRYSACEGGQRVLVSDPSDFDDGNECTSDACTIEGHEHRTLPGTVCTGGICDYGGVCRPCDTSACPDPTECMMPLCLENGCGLGPRPRGTLCAMDTNQCDGEGNCVDCTDNGGCGECCVCSAQNTCVAA